MSSSSPNSADPAPTPKRRRKPLMALLLGTLLALGAAEIVVRAYDSRAGRAASPAAIRAEMREIVEQMTEIEVGDGEDTTERAKTSKEKRGIAYALHPYSGYVTTVGYTLIDETVAYFRGEEADDYYNVMVVGGSVAANFVGSKRGVSLEIEAGISGEPELDGKTPRVMRFAFAGYRQPQQLELLSYLLVRGCRPAVVVNLDGLNEVRVAAQNAIRGIPPTWPSVGHWASLAAPPFDDEMRDLMVEIRMLQESARELMRKTLDRRLDRSVLLGRGVVQELVELRLRWSETQERVTAKTLEDQRNRKDSPFGERVLPEDPIADSLDCWLESSFAMSSLCAAYGIRYVHMLQPTLHDRGSKKHITKTEKRRGMPNDEYDGRVVRGYGILREGIAELRERGVEAHDTSFLFEFVEETIYTDSCHPNREGNQIIGRRLIGILLE